MAGKALVTDSWRFDNRQTDWYAGVEIRLGSMRISAASRTWGPSRTSPKNSGWRTSSEPAFQ
jgi:hypothetical protein